MTPVAPDRGRGGVPRLAAVVLGVLTAACAQAARPAAARSVAPISPATPAPSKGHTLVGHVSTTDCGKFGTYDIVNATVQVRDESGSVIGSTTTDTQPDPICVVSFHVPGLPTSSSYRLRVGYDRGPTYTLQQLRRADWEVSFTLGEEESSATTMNGNGPGDS